MKKAISVFLSILCVFMTLTPAFAAEGDVTEEKTKYTVTFAEPATGYENTYAFAKTVNGVVQFEPDEDGLYCKWKNYENRYVLYSSLLPAYYDEVEEGRYSPVFWDPVTEVEEGEVFSFRVITNEKYNVNTVRVFINGAQVSLNARDEYAVRVDSNLLIDVIEKDENNEEVLLRNHYNVKLTSGEEYKVLTLKNENYQVSYYGDSFRFRVKVLDGYNASGMKVSVMRGPGMLSGLLDEEDMDMIVGITGEAEELKSYGVDADGCRLYEITNITTDCRVMVSGLQEESSAGLMAMFKRILRLILDFLGLSEKLGFLDSLTAYYTVKIDGAQAPEGVTYQIIRSTSDELTPDEFNVGGGDGVTIIVTKKDEKQNVNVSWNPGNEFGDYVTEWKASYNNMTGETLYSAVYNVDNISADTVISITG